MINQPFNLPASVPDVHPAGVEQLVIAASRNEQLLLDFRRLLTPRHLFKPDEFAARVAYHCMLTAKDRYHGLSWESLCYSAAEYFEQHPDEADLSHGQAYQRLYGAGGLFVAMLTPTPATVADNNFAREILRSLATERLVVEQLRRSVNPRSPMPDVSAMLATVQASYRDIATVNVLPQVSAFPVFGAELHQESAVTPTGHHLIDSRVGGQRVGDANGIVGYTGGGKAQPLDAVVMAAVGPKQMGDIVVGEFVCDPATGGFTVVTGVYPQGKLPVYELVFSDGSRTRCCGDHLWLVDSIMGHWKGRVLTTDQLRAKLTTKSEIRQLRPRYSVGLTSPVSFKSQQVWLDPYLMGVILGDGGLSGGGVIVSTADEFMVGEIRRLLPEGFVLKKKSTTKYDYRINNAIRKGGQSNGVVEELRRLRLLGKRSYEKHIPDEYLYTDVAARWALLQGLMDTDGYVMQRAGWPDRCRLEFTTTSYEMHRQVVWLVQSLGGLATVNVKKTVKYRDAYRICVKMDDSAQCFRLPRKKLLCGDRRQAVGKKHPVKRIITAIREVGVAECQCIAVDSPAKLYLTDEFIVTHNTTLSVDMAVSACKQSLYEHHTHGSALQPVVFITAEEPAANLRARMWSNYFDIPRAKLEPTIVWDRLSTPGTMEDYELRMQSGSQRVMSERERYMALREDAEKVMVVLDLSGSPPFEHCGRGGIDEIATYVDQVCQNFGVPPKSVFVDYAGLLVEREVGVKSKDASADAYFHLKRFADDFRMKISAKFQTTSWLLQQLKGEAGKYSPTKILTLDDAAGCKSFADNMAMCLMMGIPDASTGIRMLHFAKTRYKPTEAHIPPVLLKIHREFSRMEDMSTQYVTAASSRRFIERSQANQIGGFSE